MRDARQLSFSGGLLTRLTFNVTVLSPGATANGLSPASLPTAASGSVFTVVLTGTGFVPQPRPNAKNQSGRSGQWIAGPRHEYFHQYR